MRSVAARSCMNHPQRRAVGLCQRCAKPLCLECAIYIVAVDAFFCSQECRQSALSAEQAKRGAEHERELIAGLRDPFATGIKLWLRSLPALALRLAPVACVIGLAYSWGIQPTHAQPGNDVSDFSSDWAAIALLAFSAYGIALAGVILSQRHRGAASESSFGWALRRLLPWMASWALVITAILVGALLLIVPGVYLGMRLFWAGDYALIHRAGPIHALEESWKLTENKVGAILMFQALAVLFAYGIALAFSIAFTMLSFFMVVISEAVGAEGWLVGSAAAWTFLLGYSLFHALQVARFYSLRLGGVSL